MKSFCLSTFFPRFSCLILFNNCHYHTRLCVDAFMALRKHAHRITLLVELSSMGNSHLPCFDGRPRQVVDELRDRLMPHINDAGIAIIIC